MAVYTPFERPDFEQVCAAFGLGAYVEAHPIPQGSINTNYRLQTEEGRFFLRHTHVRTEADLAFEAALLSHLHQVAFPAPTLVTGSGGRPFLPLKGGWVTVFGWLSGEEKAKADLGWDELRALGRELGKLHRVGNSFTPERPNPYGPKTVRGWLEALSPHPDLGGTAKALQEALDLSETYGDFVPRGVIHADLFRDNVKWLGDRVSALFDFEMACTEAWVLDLGITLDAWCFRDGYQKELCRALVAGYQEERPLTEGEGPALYKAALFGAVRFATSRIRDFHLSDLPADRLFRKDHRTWVARVAKLRALGPSGFEALWAA